MSIFEKSIFEKLGNIIPVPLIPAPVFSEGVTPYFNRQNILLGFRIKPGANMNGRGQEIYDANCRAACVTCGGCEVWKGEDNYRKIRSGGNRHILEEMALREPVPRCVEYIIKP